MYYRGVKLDFRVTVNFMNFCTTIYCLKRLKEGDAKQRPNCSHIVVVCALFSRSAGNQAHPLRDRLEIAEMVFSFGLDGHAES